MNQPKTYRKKPIEIEALQFTGNNIRELKDFVGKSLIVETVEGSLGSDDIELYLIKTLEGEMHVCINDYIIRGIKGEFYPCKPDIFEATYELVAQ